MDVVWNDDRGPIEAVTNSGRILGNWWIVCRGQLVLAVHSDAATCRPKYMSELSTAGQSSEY